MSLSALALSCNEDNFLDIKPQGSLSEENLASAEGVDYLVTAAYAGLMGIDGADATAQIPMTNWSYGEVHADNAYKGGGGVGDVSDIHSIETYDIDETLSNLDSKWFQLYCCVQRCNSALRVLNSCSEDEVDNLEIQKAEMRVLRAHFYFELSRLFNKIPYFDENVENNEEYTSIPNDEYTRDEILGMIAQELADAAEILPETQTDLGRVNKYVAYAYEAKVKLYQAYEQDENTHAVTNINNTLLQEVVDLCDEVISSNKYGLLDDFQQLDLVAYENGKESIFAVQYSTNDGSDNGGRINWSNLLNTPQGPYSGDGFFLPSQNLVNAYQTDENGLPLFDTFNDNDFDAMSSTSDESTYQQSNQTVDPRLDFVVGRPGVTWKTYTEESCAASWVRDRGTYGFHCSKRFLVSPESSDMIEGWPWGASGLNWQIIRYADILLWKAEALIELNNGGLDEARELINQIRRRAKNSTYVKNFTNSDQDAANYLINEYPATGWTQDYARQALRFETRLEKAMEGERFFDLVRWGIAEDVMNAYFEKEKSSRTYYVNSQFQSAKDEYMPIPRSQYNFSLGTYVQNPGYGSF